MTTEQMTAEHSLTSYAQGVDPERIAQLIAHRACCGSEHDPSQGKFHGYCVVCGVPWPCAYAGTPPSLNPAEEIEAK